MKLYLAGPMRGIKAYNHPAFDKAAAELAAQGHEVFSPAQHDRELWPDRDWANFTGDELTGADMRKVIMEDLTWISNHAEGIALLPGWTNSRGARAEHSLAQFLELHIMDLTPKDDALVINSILDGKSPAERKEHPIGTGVLDYFPDALLAVANVSYRGNQQHNPGQPLHWARGKSADEADALLRHYLARGSLDDDGLLHSAKLAWRALALLQKELEARNGLGPSRGSRGTEIVIPKDHVGDDRGASAHPGEGRPRAGHEVAARGAAAAQRGTELPVQPH